MRGTFTGFDPDAVAHVATELDVAAAEVGDLARSVASLLASVGAPDAPPGLSSTIAWCEASARDLRRRAAAVAIERWIATATAGWPSFLVSLAAASGSSLARAFATAAGGSVPEDPAKQLVGLLGVGEGSTPEWVLRAYPRLAVARRDGRVLAAEVGKARALLAVDVQSGRVGWRVASERARVLDRLEARALLQGRPTVAGVAEFLARLHPDERRRVVIELGEWARSLDLAAMSDVERTYLRAALGPARDVLAEESRSLARDIWMDPVRASGTADVDHLAEMTSALEIPEPETTSPVVAFADGLVRGSFNQEGYGGLAGVAFAGGQFVSGIVAVGDARDLAANLAAGRWADAGFDAIGIFPIVGEVAKGTRAADAASDAMRSARRGADAAGDARAAARAGDGPNTAARAAAAAEDPARLVDSAGRPTRNLENVADPEEGLPGGSLQAHEGVGGGHALERHGGKSDEFLRQRKLEENKKSVSTFTDERTADWAVDTAIRENASEIREWLASGEWHADLRVELDTNVGRILDGSDVVRPGRKVVVRLKRDTQFEYGWRVHTAFVE